MKLSDQALGAVMLALQKSLMEQSDITATLKNFDFVVTGPDQSQLVITNPPTIKFDNNPLDDQNA